MSQTKYSRQREALLNVLRGTTCHPNADRIYDMVREEIPNISLGTVYRNLATLADDGVILKLDVGDGCEHYDGDISPHAHFYCKNCRRIYDIFEDYGKALCANAQEKLDGKVDNCTVMFDGICRECMISDTKKENKSSI